MPSVGVATTAATGRWHRLMTGSRSSVWLQASSQNWSKAAAALWPELLHSQGTGHAWQSRQRQRAKVMLAYLCALADWLAAVWFLLLAILGLSGEMEVAGGSGSAAAKRRHVAGPCHPLQASLNTAAPHQRRRAGRQQLDVTPFAKCSQMGTRVCWGQHRMPALRNLRRSSCTHGKQAAPRIFR